ncbi:hypothetical protein MZ16F85_37840 [Escherichia coli]
MLPLLKVEAGNYEKSHSANQRRYRRFSPDSFSGVSLPEKQPIIFGCSSYLRNVCCIGISYTSQLI